MIFIFTSNNKQIWWHFLPAYLCPINMWYENWTYHAGSIGQKHFTTTNALWSLSHYPLMWKNIFPYKSELEQLERLRSEILPAAPWLPILVIHIRSQVKTTQSQSYKFWKIAKIPNFEILQETLHTTHLLKLLYKMHKYEMDPTRTVEATERTLDAGRTRDGRGTDGRMDGRSETNIPPNNFVSL